MSPSQEFGNGAFLHFADGRVLLSVNDMQYSADDTVPTDIRGPAVVTGPASARHFVNACMIIEYGRNEQVWPELARRFVSGN